MLYRIPLFWLVQIFGADFTDDYGYIVLSPAQVREHLLRGSSF